MIDAIPAMAWSALPDGSVDFVNQRWRDYAGLSLQEARGRGWQAAVHPDDSARLIHKWREILLSKAPGEIEARLKRFDGQYRWFLIRAEPALTPGGEVLKWYGANTDIEDRKRAESLLSAEKRTLELIAGGASLADILDNLCRTIDAESPQVISTVLLMDPDGRRLWPASGPRVPRGWSKIITPLEIGPGVGSCGTAAFTKKRVVVADIEHDPLWAEMPYYRDLALQHGLRASWSEPLLSKNQEVLGTFAMYYSEPRTPGDGDLQLIEGAGHVAVIAIEGERSQTALTKAFEEIKQSKFQLDTIINAIPQLIVVLAPDGNTLYANQTVLEYTGFSPDDISADEFRARVFHPEDVERLSRQRQNAIAAGVPFQLEQRARRKDGQYRWCLIHYNPLRDEAGNVLRWYATGIDIHDRKQAEERIERENLALREEIDLSSMFEEIVGSSQPLRRVLWQVAKVAPADSTVLIQGETGTGKELIARAIHKRSSRAARAFVRVNCAGIPPSLMASELFGHEKGAFTGALQRRLGRFELADGGTIFLDEIGELSAKTQASLLRVLQEREFERVGSSEPIRVDVRVLAATNRDLKSAVAAGTFRQDLFYRLNVFPVRMPSLRERVDDIPLLVEYLIDRYAKKSGKKIRHVEQKTMELFKAYNWPGNIRELQNVVERAVILCDGDTFSIEETWLKSESAQSPAPTVTFVATIAEREREMIEAALAECRGRIAGAAAKLGMPRQTLESKISSLHIDKHRFASR
ncbi:MAG: sigma 54-interacting transcriptional regulator [Tepidisphaeraceae bacterium]|jgi:formate hydrogenlyase transcriptional activator